MRIRVVSVATLAAASGLVAPGVASATIHTGRIVFPGPHNPPSIGVPPPPVQTKESTREVIIRYNASAGTVTFRAELFDPTLRHAHIVRILFSARSPRWLAQGEARRRSR